MEEVEVMAVDPSELVDKPIVKKKRRGRPSNDSSQRKKAQPSNAATVDDDDIWEEVIVDQDFRQQEFRFVPAKEPGVLADLDGSSTPYDCFTELFTVEVQEKLVDMINTYAVFVVISMGIDRRASLID